MREIWARHWTRIRELAGSQPTRALLELWLAATTTAALALFVAKANNIASITRTPLGRQQLAADSSVLSSIGWFFSDIVAALIIGGLLALVFGLARSQRARRAAFGGLMIAEIAFAVGIVVCIEVYALFGVPPTWQLLDSLSDADNATDSVATLVDLRSALLGGGLIVLLAVGTPLLRRLIERRPRLGARLALALAASTALIGSAAALGSASRFELQKNPFLTFAKSALIGQSLAASADITGSFPMALAPISELDQQAPMHGYRSLQSWVRQRSEAPSVVVVILETMAVRHMGLMGADVDNTPTFERLASRGVLWSWHYAHAPSSMFAIYSVLCANHGEPHGPHISKTRPRIDCRSLSEVLSERGYRAGLFHSGRHSYSEKDRFFAGRGYEVFYDTQSMPNRDRYEESSWGIEERASIDALLAWVAEDRSAPFFATYIPVYPHHPYTVPHRKYRKFSGGGDVGRYRNSVYYVDQMIAELLEGLREQGALEDTFFVFVGDHGEGFGEHPGSRLHGSKIYDEAIRTFALFYAPGALSEPVVDQRPTGHVDIAPTLLDILGIGAQPSHVGTSALVEGRLPMVPIYTGYGHPLVGFVDGRYKFIHNRRSHRSELYDLRDDPGEKRSLDSEQVALVHAYRRRVEQFVALQQKWEDDLPSLQDRAIDDFPGRDEQWVVEPASCDFAEGVFAVVDGGLHMLRADEKTVVCRHALPATPGAVTGLTVRGIETYNGAFITAMVVWRKDEERRQVAYCTLNGNSDAVGERCDADLVPGTTELGGGGRLELELRYVTTEPEPDYERFAIHSAEIRYRIREE